MNIQPNTTRFTLRIPARVKRWVSDEANERGVSDNAFISLILQEKMAAEEKFGRQTSAAE